jgi:hypothetical protein
VLDRSLHPSANYELGLPVMGRPRALNEEAVLVASDFLKDAAGRHQRFLALGFEPSYETLRWLADGASGTHDVRLIGKSDRIAVLEFAPRAKTDASHSDLSRLDKDLPLSASN